jgi:hypothetical protein
MERDNRPILNRKRKHNQITVFRQLNSQSYTNSKGRKRKRIEDMLYALLTIYSSDCFDPREYLKSIIKDNTLYKIRLSEHDIARIEEEYVSNRHHNDEHGEESDIEISYRAMLLDYNSK